MRRSDLILIDQILSQGDCRQKVSIISLHFFHFFESENSLIYDVPAAVVINCWVCYWDPNNGIHYNEHMKTIMCKSLYILYLTPLQIKDLLPKDGMETPQTPMVGVWFT